MSDCNRDGEQWALPMKEKEKEEDEAAGMGAGRNGTEKKEDSTETQQQGCSEYWMDEEERNERESRGGSTRGWSVGGVGLRPGLGWNSLHPNDEGQSIYFHIG